MTKPLDSLRNIYEGWGGYQQSLVNVVKPLAPEQLNWCPAENFFSVGELVRHISLGRLTWLLRMGAPGSSDLTNQIDDWQQDGDGNRNVVEESIAISDQSIELVRWLDITWQVIENFLSSWNVADLWQTYRHTWNGKVYCVSRQWTIWRLMNHDIHHGGELSLMLGLQGIEAFELSSLFGHTIQPPLSIE
ncbi:MAG: DinB family protein [Anaerolineales bacterium]